MAPWRRVAALVWLGGSASFVVPPGAGRVPTSVRSAETSDLEEEARIREKLEEWSTRPGEGRKWGKRMNGAREKRRKKRGASFEEAQAISVDLGRELARCQREGERVGEDARRLLDELISTTASARGWFVVLLTSPEFGPLFEAPIEEALLDAIAERPEPNRRLCVMNVAMSTATALAHDAAGHPDLAAASRETAHRSRNLVAALFDRVDGLREAVRTLADAADADPKPRDDVDLGDLEALLEGRPPAPACEWAEFLVKWAYDAPQRAAIRDALYALLDEDEVLGGYGTPLFGKKKKQQQ